MEFDQLINSRRSLRSFQKADGLTAEEVEQMVAAAQQSPSWKNSQTARVYAAISDEAVKAVSDSLPEYNKNNTKNAVGYFAVTFVHSIAGFGASGAPVDELGDAWGGYDLGLHNMLLLLKAKELGYDTLVMGLRNVAEIRKIFSIPETEKLVSVIAVGKGAIEPKKPVRKEIGEVLKLF